MNVLQKSIWHDYTTVLYKNVRQYGFQSLFEIVLGHGVENGKLRSQILFICS